MAAHQAAPSLGFSRQEHWSGLPFPSPMHESEKWKWSRSVVSDSSRPHGLRPTRLLHPWNFPGKSTGVGCHCLLRSFWLLLGVLWKEWCWSWNSSTLATSCEELTHWQRLWCWEGLGAGGEGDDRGWDGWMASLTQWTWVWVNSGSWWWTGRPGVLRFMGSQRVAHDWATEQNWIKWIQLHSVKCKETLIARF